MQTLIYLACLPVLSFSTGFQGDCPKPAYCRAECRSRKSQDECMNSCFFLADQCCTFCFTSSDGSSARNDCIGQCPATVRQELENPVTSTAQPTSSNVTRRSVSSNKTRRTQLSPAQRQKVATAHAAVTESQHLTKHLKTQERSIQHPILAPTAPMGTVAPPSPCGDHCKTVSHPGECSIQCEAMHQACTTNCLVVYEDPSVRQPCIDHCISLVVVQSHAAFMTPPPAFDVIEATHVTPPPGPELAEPLPPTPRSSPQATKAANALHENGVLLPENVGLKLRHHSLSRPSLTLALL